VPWASIEESGVAWSFGVVVADDLKSVKLSESLAPGTARAEGWLVMLSATAARSVFFPVICNEAVSMITPTTARPLTSHLNLTMFCFI
jgi:hypothetical protein